MNTIVPANFACKCGHIVKAAKVGPVDSATIRTEIVCICGNKYQNVYLNVGGTISNGGSTSLYPSGYIGEVK